MGLTVEQLNDMLKAGKVVTSDFLPKFLNQMQQAVTENGSLEAAMKKSIAEMQRMFNVIQKGIDTGFEAGGEAFPGFFRDMTQIFKENESTFKMFGATLGAGLRTISILLKTLVSPALVIVNNSFDTMRMAMDSALDATKKWGDLTVIESGLRVLGLLASGLHIALLKVRLELLRLGEAVGLGDDELGVFGKQLKALLVVFLSIGVGIRLFRALIWNSMVVPFWQAAKAIGKWASAKKLAEAGIKAASKGSKAAPAATDISAGSSRIGAALSQRPKGGIPFKEVGKWTSRAGRFLGTAGSLFTLYAFIDDVAKVLPTLTDTRPYYERIGMSLDQFQKYKEMGGLNSPAAEQYRRSITNYNTYEINSTDPQGVAREIERINRQLYEAAALPTP